MKLSNKIKGKGCKGIRMKKKLEVYRNIGLLGLHRSSGVTHLTLLMAQYLRGCLGHNVTVLEKSGRSDLDSLSNYYPFYKKCTNGFYLHGIQFLINDSLSINNDEDRCVLIDFGTNYKGFLETQEKLDILIYVYTNAPWYQGEDFLRKYMEVKKNLKIAVICNMATKKSLKKGLSLSMKPSVLGLEPDFFNPSVESIRVFESILCI